MSTEASRRVRLRSRPRPRSCLVMAAVALFVIASASDAALFLASLSMEAPDTAWTKGAAVCARAFASRVCCWSVATLSWLSRLHFLLTREIASPRVLIVGSSCRFSESSLARFFCKTWEASSYLSSRWPLHLSIPSTRRRAIGGHPFCCSVDSRGSTHCHECRIENRHQCDPGSDGARAQTH